MAQIRGLMPGSTAVSGLTVCPETYSPRIEGAGLSLAADFPPPAIRGASICPRPLGIISTVRATIADSNTVPCRFKIAAPPSYGVDA
jgi:hypothetical protein